MISLDFTWLLQSECDRNLFRIYPLFYSYILVSAGSRQIHTIEKIDVRISASNVFSESPCQKTVPAKIFRKFGSFLVDWQGFKGEKWTKIGFLKKAQFLLKMVPIPPFLTKSNTSKTFKTCFSVLFKNIIIKLWKRTFWTSRPYPKMLQSIDEGLNV